jgi:ABC-2 type transport system permease protein
MRALTHITAVEGKLFFRDATWLVSLFLPTFVLVVMYAIPALRETSEAFGGYRVIDLYVPTMIAMTLAILAVNTMPIRLSGYRERGVLRRLSTTPVHPANLLAAQLIVNALAAIASVVVLVVVGRIVLGIPMPQHVLGFVAAFALGTAAVLAIGILIAAIAPTNRGGSAIAYPLFFAVMFLSGVYFPRWFLPEIVQRIGDFTPPGVQAMLDAWLGAGPDPIQVVAMAIFALFAGFAAIRLFRWE